MTATALTTGDDAEDKEGQGGMTGLQSGQLTGWLLADKAAYPKSHIQKGTLWAKEILALWNRNGQIGVNPN